MTRGTRKCWRYSRSPACVPPPLSLKRPNGCRPTIAPVMPRLRWSLPALLRGRSFRAMRTLTVDEAVAGLGKWLELALAGEEIQIRQGNSVVELRPTTAPRQALEKEPLSPREALRRLQQDARLTSTAAGSYLREVHEERLAAEERRPA